MRMLKEFKEFAIKGNMIDLAIGVVIGAAFNKIIDSLVKDIIMPPLGFATGGIDFADKKLVLKPAVLDAAGKVTTPEVALNWGLFVNAAVQFVLIAFALFMVVKAINAVRRQEAAAPVPDPAPTRQEILLEEIRDALKARP
jgi:large conductance mechanosensitive channel